MVEVIIDDEDPAQAMPAEEVLGADRGIVEEAEAHGPRGLGVMTWRPDKGDGALNGSVHDPVERFEEAARRKKRGRPHVRGPAIVSASIGTVFPAVDRMRSM